MGACAPKFPGGGERARRAGDPGPLGAGEGGDRGDRRGGAGALHPPGSGDPGPGRGARLIRPACGVILRPQGAGGTRPGKGCRRWRRGGGGSARAGKSTRPTAVPAGRPPPNPRRPRGRESVSGVVTGGDYSLVRAVVQPPLTGRAGGGRRLRGDRPELRRQLRSPRPAHTRRRLARPPQQSSAQL